MSNKIIGRGKKYTDTVALFDSTKFHSLPDALEVLFKLPSAKFDESIDFVIPLDFVAKKDTPNIRFVTVLPHGTGIKKKIKLVLSSEELNELDTSNNLPCEITDVDTFVAEIKLTKKVDFDVCIATPSVMPKLGEVARVLGPRGLMPNPKTGTVTLDFANAVNDFSKGKLEIKTDKKGVIHTVLGKKSFNLENVLLNANHLLKQIEENRPESVKSKAIKSAYISTTMGPSININLNL